MVQNSQAVEETAAIAAEATAEEATKQIYVCSHTMECMENGHPCGHGHLHYHGKECAVRFCCPEVAGKEVSCVMCEMRFH